MLLFCVRSIIGFDSKPCSTEWGVVLKLRIKMCEKSYLGVCLHYAAIDIAKRIKFRRSVYGLDL